MPLWIRLDSDWQRDPLMRTMRGVERHVISTLWCLATDLVADGRGVVIRDEFGKPRDVEIPLQFLEPSGLANEAGVPYEDAQTALQKARDGVPEFAVPPAVVLDVPRGVAVIRSVGKKQEKLLGDRARMAEARGKKKPKDPQSIPDDPQPTPDGSPTVARLSPDGPKSSPTVPVNGDVYEDEDEATERVGPGGLVVHSSRKSMARVRAPGELALVALAHEASRLFDVDLARHPIRHAVDEWLKIRSGAQIGCCYAEIASVMREEGHGIRNPRGAIETLVYEFPDGVKPNWHRRTAGWRGCRPSRSHYSRGGLRSLLFPWSHTPGRCLSPCSDRNPAFSMPVQDKYTLT